MKNVARKTSIFKKKYIMFLDTVIIYLIRFRKKTFVNKTIETDSFFLKARMPILLFSLHVRVAFISEGNKAVASEKKKESFGIQIMRINTCYLWFSYRLVLASSFQITEIQSIHIRNDMQSTQTAFDFSVESFVVFICRIIMTQIAIRKYIFIFYFLFFFY